MKKNTLTDPVEAGEEMIKHWGRKLYAETLCKALAATGWRWYEGAYRVANFVGDAEIVAEFDFGMDAFKVSIPDLPGISGHVNSTADLDEWIFELKNFVVSGIASAKQCNRSMR